MNAACRPIILESCPKMYERDLDKAAPPEQTLRNVSAALANVNLDIFAGAERVDTGRLDIPVYMGICGLDARAVMPARKQMGKGSSLAQAQASALMEVMERYAFFSFWAEERNMIRMSWEEAEKRFGDSLISPAEILASVNDSLDEKTARKILNLADWLFYPATRLADGQIVWLPLDWFRMLGEFNGSSAGNTAEESILQGLSELVERHACAIADQAGKPLPTIDAANSGDATLDSLLAKFEKEKINLILKDFSGDMPIPVVAALAWDPATFPQKSEIVFTAGAASSPQKAAIRAVTEVAQLAGDFCSNSCYEASGLPKFASLAECQWLLEGPAVPLRHLPDISASDMAAEIRAALAGLEPIKVYAAETTSPLLNIPAHYCIAPGLQFRERDRNQSLGLFAGRKLAENAEPRRALDALDRLGQLLPDAFYLPFFKGLAELRRGGSAAAICLFEAAIPLQPDADARAMACFYAGYGHTLSGQWRQAIPHLREAAGLCPGMKEYANLLGVSLYKTGQYGQALECFEKALKIDKGSAIDLANRGLCHELLGKTESAAEDFRAALSLDSSINFAAEHLANLEEKS